MMSLVRSNSKPFATTTLMCSCCCWHVWRILPQEFCVHRWCSTPHFTKKKKTKWLNWTEITLNIFIHLYHLTFSVLFSFFAFLFFSTHPLMSVVKFEVCVCVCKGSKVVQNYAAILGLGNLGVACLCSIYSRRTILSLWASYLLVILSYRAEGSPVFITLCTCCSWTCWPIELQYIPAPPPHPLPFTCVAYLLFVVWLLSWILLKHSVVCHPTIAMASKSEIALSLYIKENSMFV